MADLAIRLAKTPRPQLAEMRWSKFFMTSRRREGVDAAPAWLNRTVVGAGITSFLADVGYEMATAVYRDSSTRKRDGGPSRLGLIEGVRIAVEHREARDRLARRPHRPPQAVRRRRLRLTGSRGLVFAAGGR